jgi:hypothetical protein
MVREISIELSQCARGKSGRSSSETAPPLFCPATGELRASLSKRTAHDNRHPDSAQVAEHYKPVHHGHFNIDKAIREERLCRIVFKSTGHPRLGCTRAITSEPGMVGRRSELVRRYADTQARAVTVHKLEFSCIGSRAKWVRINSRNTRTFGDRLSRVGYTAWNSTWSGSQSGKTRMRRP